MYVSGEAKRDGIECFTDDPVGQAHAGQYFAVAERSPPQCAQLRVRGVAHSSQNFAAFSFSRWQRGHFTVVGCARVGVSVPISSGRTGPAHSVLHSVDPPLPIGFALDGRSRLRDEAWHVRDFGGTRHMRWVVHRPRFAKTLKRKVFPCHR